MSAALHILYIEDDPGLARLTQRVLGREGMHVDTVSGGDQAFEEIQNNVYDAILVDYRLPGMDGLEITHALVGKEDTPPIVMITGEGNETLAVESLKAGAADYIVKDSQSQFLKLAPMRIRQAIDQAQLLRDKQAAETAQKQLLAELDAFAHTVAHDIKSPLQNILMNLEVLEMAEGEKRKKIAGLFRTELQRSKRIVDSLLLLATVRKEKLQLRTIKLSTSFSGAMMRLQPQIDEANAQLESPADWPLVIGRSDWLEEIWANYISNALRYGGDSPHIQIGWEQRGTMIRAWVQDHGPGVTKDQEVLLFAPLESRDNSIGTGLGLSIVSRIMNRLDGNYGLDSSWQKGARFYFEIPLG